LNCWYQRLTGRGDFKTETPSEFFGRLPRRRTLKQLHTGSWISANFDIWIGEDEENEAWGLLAEARAFLENRASDLDEEKLSLALQEIYAAEGSDWFWWYGPDFNTDNDLLFDQLFRTHLQNVYRLCGEAPPDKLNVPVCRRNLTESVMMPIGLIHPIVDGEQTHFFEWQEAGIYRVAQGRGTMFQGNRLIKCIYFGFDLQNFHLRIDAQNSWKLSKPVEVVIHFASEEMERELHIRLPIAGLKPEAGWRNGEDASANSPFQKLAIQKVLELSVPLEEVGWAGGEKARFAIELLQDGTQTERHPELGFIEVEVPDRTFESVTWKL